MVRKYTFRVLRFYIKELSIDWKAVYSRIAFSKVEVNLRSGYSSGSQTNVQKILEVDLYYRWFQN